MARAGPSRAGASQSQPRYSQSQRTQNGGNRGFSEDDDDDAEMQNDPMESDREGEANDENVCRLNSHIIIFEQADISTFCTGVDTESE
jgi:hypothetical protein